MATDNPFSDMKAINLNDFATNPGALEYPEPANDLEGLNTPACWPYRPMCPMVNRKHPMERTRLRGMPDIGIVLEGQVGAIYTGDNLSIFDILNLPSDKQIQIVQENMQKTEFGSWEKLLEAGWECD